MVDPGDMQAENRKMVTHAGSLWHEALAEVPELSDPTSAVRRLVRRLSERLIQREATIERLTRHLATWRDAARARLNEQGLPNDKPRPAFSQRPSPPEGSPQKRKPGIYARPFLVGQPIRLE